MKLIEKYKDKKKNIIFEIMAILLISIFGFSIAPKTLQNDTYYTVSIGNLILENGIDMKDHYSWHEDLPYTYPHWLYDVIMSEIYNLGGWNGIYISTCILSIILGIVIYKVNSKLNKNQIISFFVTIGTMYLLKSYIAARAQLVTFIIFAIIIYLIEKFLENPKKIRLCHRNNCLLNINCKFTCCSLAIYICFSFALYCRIYSSNFCRCNSVSKILYIKT